MRGNGGNADFAPEMTPFAPENMPFAPENGPHSPIPIWATKGIIPIPASLDVLHLSYFAVR